ncbi:MAG: hypothetical protein AAF922_05830 [Pseudomonadota bacterium]
MTELNLLRYLAKGYDVVPPGVFLHALKDVFRGAGGNWQPAFWFCGFNQVRVALVPLDGGCPVALQPVWTDPSVAVEAARKAAAFAAEC